MTFGTTLKPKGGQPELVMCLDCSAYFRCGRGLHVTADGKFPERNLEHDGCAEGRLRRGALRDDAEARA